MSLLLSLLLWLLLLLLLLILDTINHKNVSGIFLKDFNFSELLGDIKYDEHGRIIGELIGMEWNGID